MRLAIVLIFLFLFSLNSWTQEFGCNWVSYPLPNDSSEVFFRKTYTTPYRPKLALLTFASSGSLRVYVNERNITKDVYFENRDSNNICSYTVDISRYLYPDSNVISVWYAPCKGMPISKQLSLEYHGYTIKGVPFYHKADQSWVCQTVPRCHTGSQEQYDNRNVIKEWKSIDYIPRKWLHPLGAIPQERLLTIEATMLAHSSHLMTRILSPISCYPSGESTVYDLGKIYEGTFRITLRNTKKGEEIYIDDFKYVCNGELDEQAFRHFTKRKQRTIVINGDVNFTPSQIVNMEFLQYQHTRKFDFSY